MKTNVTCSLESDLVARLDAWRAPMNCGRSHALELLLESLPEPAKVGAPGDEVTLEEFFDAPVPELGVQATMEEAVIQLPVVSDEDGMVTGPVETEEPVTEPDALVVEEPAHKSTKKKHK